MSILVVGDLHLKKDNEIESSILLEDILYIISTRDISFVILLGDIMNEHETLNLLVLERATKFIEKISELKPLYILIGNHDRRNNKDFLSPTHAFVPFKRWNNVTIVDTCHILEWNSKKICMVPFVPDGRFMEALSVCDVNIKEIDLFFAHQEFAGCSINRISKHKCDEWKDEYPLLISGHIHEQEIVAWNLMYIGTPYQQTFAESPDKGIFLLDEFLQLEMIEINVPRKVHKIISYNEIDSIYPNPNEKLKLTIQGPVKVVKEILARDVYLKRFKGVRILYKDTTKERRIKVSFTTHMSFTERLKSELSKNKEMDEIYTVLFSEN